MIGILSDRMAPGPLDRAEQALRDPKSAAVLIPHMPPADTFYLAVEFRKRFPEQSFVWGPAGRELDDLSRKDPADASPERPGERLWRASPDAGKERYARRLLNTGAVSFLWWGYASRFWRNHGNPTIFIGRAWPMRWAIRPSCSTCWSRADAQMVANIFATNIDDWPALLRAMKETGEEFRQGKITVEAAGTIARQQESGNLECASCGSER